MSYWAEIDENNIVLRVTVGNDEHIDEGYHWLVGNLGGRWIKTSFNGSIRKNFASVGFTYDEERDAFIAPKTFDSWILNEDTCIWEAPIAYPSDGGSYEWNEENLTWQLIEEV